MRSWLLLLVLSLPAALFAADWSAPGRYKVGTSEGVWLDAKRDRKLPYRIYMPADRQDPCPIVLLSHGLGGNRNGYVYLGEHFASHGYASVHLQHPGSDTDAIRAAVQRGEKAVEAMREAARDIGNAIDRPRDVSFAIDQLEKAAADGGALAGKLDLKRVGVTGHSFGAYTAMAIAGQSGGRLSLRDPRVSAAIGMSAPAPKGAGTYAAIEIPVLLMTGTLDDSPLLGGTAQQRIAAFDQLKLSDRFLVVFEGGDHMVFSGRSDALAALRLPGMSGDRSRDEILQAKIAGLSLAFLEAYECDNAAAEQWLKRQAGRELGELARWEYRPPQAAR